MADDTQWPSENEDFDATISKAKKSKSTTTKVQVSEEGAPEPESVVEPTEEVADTEGATDTEQDAPSEESSPEAESNSEASSEPEAAVESEAVQDTAPEPETSPGADNHSSQRPPQKALASNSGGVSKGRLAVEAVLVVLVVGLGLWAWTLYNDKSNLQDQVAKLNANPQIAVKKQSDDLIAKVGGLINLPTGETPTIATVSDLEAAKKQSAFFNNAQNGDKVLMYVKAGQAILYRPSTNKIILVAPLTLNNSAAATSSSSATTKATTTKKSHPVVPNILQTATFPK